MSTTQKTIGELVDEAFQGMPRWKRLLTHRAFKRNRNEIIQRVGYRLSIDPQTTQLIHDMGVFEMDTFDEGVIVMFDPDKLKAILDLILEYLPLILDLFSGLGIRRMAIAGLVLICFAVAPKSSYAADWLGGVTVGQQCTDGSCGQEKPRPVRNIVKAAADIVLGPPVPVPLPAVSYVHEPPAIVYAEPVAIIDTQPAITRTFYIAKSRTFRRQPVRRLGRGVRGFARRVGQRLFGCR